VRVPPAFQHLYRKISAETSLFFLPFARRSTQKNRTYFLRYRDAAKVCDGLSHQVAHTITLALAQLGVIEIVRKGQPGLNSREAAEFRYLLSDGKNGADEVDRD
jgi:hypothetical protein